ncbi:hypothetical protein AC579_9523 [Pseudocercospora musae]|uniref:DUF7587 domain-containing protein n=1 Tax=Pseudocercospora musae TaxID=113226 RepID=A0A139IMM3_9PEZI|nr:hypothetical protein AC579_9523 [Pseudocercospora musae]
MPIHKALDLSSPCSYVYNWAFRVVGDGPNGNHSSFDQATDSLVAEAPNTPLSMTVVRSHLLLQPDPSPFMSVYTVWHKALHRAQWLCDRGARNVRIYVIDMQEVAINYPRVIFFEATSLAASLGFRTLTPWQKRNRTHLPQWLNKENVDNHGQELLVYREIPEVRKTVLAVIPSDGPTLRFPVHLGVMEVPTELVEQTYTRAGGQPDTFRRHSTIEAIENMDQDICSEASPARKVDEIVQWTIERQLAHGPRWDSNSIVHAMQALMIEDWS